MRAASARRGSSVATAIAENLERRHRSCSSPPRMIFADGFDLRTPYIARRWHAPRRRRNEVDGAQPTRVRPKAQLFSFSQGGRPTMSGMGLIQRKRSDAPSPLGGGGALLWRAAEIRGKRVSGHPSMQSATSIRCARRQTVIPSPFALSSQAPLRGEALPHQGGRGAESPASENLH